MATSARLRPLIASIVLAACGGAKPVSPSPPTSPSAIASVASATAAKHASEDANAPAHSHLVATIDRKAIGPFGAKAGGAGIVAWIVLAERGAGEDIVVVPVGADEAPLAEPHVVASFPQEATSLVVRPAGGTRGGWLLAYSTLLDRGESVSILALATDGTARGASSDVQRTSDHVAWIDVVATSRGAACIWAEETTSGNANILAASVDSDGKPRGVPARIARGISAWTAAAAADGVGLALVTFGQSDQGGPGALSFVRLDADARPTGLPIPIGTRATVTGNVEASATSEGLLLGWTDRTGEDAQATLAFVDRDGKVRGPIAAMDTVGGSTLVALASSGQGTALAWEEPRARTRPTRLLHLASVSTPQPGQVTADPSAQSVTAVPIAGSAAPELTATESGFALLASARTCRQAETLSVRPRSGGAGDAPSHSCAGPVTPTFVRFDSRLIPTQAEPMLVGDARTGAALGWGLRCSGERCFALAASSGSPTAVYALDLPPRTSPFAPPATPAPPADAPRLSNIETIASGQPYTDVAAIQVGQSAFVAALANGATGPSGRRDRLRGAALTLYRIDPLSDGGQPVRPAATVTSRAVAVGGVGLAPGRSEDGVAVAWVARDNGGAHVHVARFDGKGRRTAETQLTAGRGDASDVAIGWANDGWLVAWVDTRDGNGEVYAAKINRDLKRVGTEERITRAPGDAGDVALAIDGEMAWLAWSDPRESPQEGIGDVYVTTLRTRDARRTGDETKVLATAGHSRSPQLAALADGGALVAWIEDAPSGLDAPGAAMVAKLDETGHVVGTPSKLPLAAEGRPIAMALQRSESTVRAVVARTVGDSVTLDAVVFSADVPAGAQPYPLVDLDAPGSFEVTVALAGASVFFDDVGKTPANHRVRRAVVGWR